MTQDRFAGWRVGVFVLAAAAGGCWVPNGGGGGGDGDADGATCGGHSTTGCAGNDVYWYDACGQRMDLAEQCTGGNVCLEGACVPEIIAAGQCGAAENCGDCLTISICGWCDGQCRPGTAAGPSSGGCDLWEWTGSECTSAHAEPGDQLGDAEPVHLSAGVPLVFTGELEDVGDVDVFALGAMAQGDRLTVDVRAADTIDGATAVFDDKGNAMLVNDHRNVFSGVAGPGFDLVIPWRASNVYLAFAATPGYGGFGAYELEVTREAGAAIFTPHPQVVVLNFQGGRDVRIGSRSAIEHVPVFDAAEIVSSLAEDTEELKDLIVQFVREDYAGLGIEINSSDEMAPNEDLTTIYFGTFDQALLGVAESVDEFNLFSSQHAIVFTDTFAAFSPLQPTVAEWALALANVASHEIGHTLGLVHTNDPVDIMDVTASLSELMLDQTFGRAPLYSSVYPIGFEDSAFLLYTSLGGDFDVFRGANEDKRAAAQKRIGGDASLFRSAAGERRPFSSCQLPEVLE